MAGNVNEKAPPLRHGQAGAGALTILGERGSIEPGAQVAEGPEEVGAAVTAAVLLVLLVLLLLLLQGLLLGGPALRGILVEGEAQGLLLPVALHLHGDGVPCVVVFLLLDELGGGDDGGNTEE